MSNHFHYRKGRLLPLQEYPGRGTRGGDNQLGIARHPSGAVAFSNHLVHEKLPFQGLHKRGKGNEILGRDSNLMGQNSNTSSSY